MDDVLNLYRQNPQFYQYTEAEPTRKQVLHDMTITPQGIKVKDKYFFGFFENRTLVAVMDLIDGYPKPEIAYIGLFMMNQDYQGRQIGTSIIGEATDYIWTTGKTAIRLAIGIMARKNESLQGSRSISIRRRTGELGHGTSETA